METKEYCKHLTGILSAGYISHSVALGKKLGIFDEMKRRDTPATLEDIANACSLKERYVCEFLGCMVASRIIEIDDEDKYYIPTNHKEHLSILNYFYALPYMGMLHDQVVNCFKKDGPNGYDYEHMPHEMMDLMDTRFADIDRLTKEIMMSLNQFKDGPILNILEVGCGAGSISRQFATFFPDALYQGIDLNAYAVEKAKERAASRGISNVSYAVCNVAELPQEWTDKFDWVMIYDVLHDLPRPVEAMAEVKRVLKDNGLATIVDPNICSNHKGNVGDLDVAGLFLSASHFLCLPSSMSAENPAALGIGWGVENKRIFLSENGWITLKEEQLCGGNAEYSFTCRKEVSKDTKI